MLCLHTRIWFNGKIIIFFFPLILYRATNFNFHFIYCENVWKVNINCYEVWKPNYFVVSVPINLFIQMFRFNQLISFDLCQSAIISAGWKVVFIITNLWFHFLFFSSLIHVRCTCTCTGIRHIIVKYM